MKEVLTFGFPLPPLEEQKRIVAILDETFTGIDQAIRNTERKIEAFKELKQSLLEQAFTGKL